MFEDLTQMEKEIETFRNNISASSELVEGISLLISETKKQKESMSASTESLIKKLEASVAQFKKDQDKAVQVLGESNDTMLNALQQNLKSEQQNRIAEIESIQGEIKKCLEVSSADADKHLKALTDTGEALTAALRQGADSFQMAANQNIEQMNSDCQCIISEAKNTMTNLQTDYEKQLLQAESTIKDYQKSAEDKYNEFVERLERTNVDQIFKQVQDLKKSVNIKFALLMSGVLATLALNIYVLLMH